MPILDNPKHEAFCQARVEGKSRDASYKIAGFRAHRSNAAKLAQNSAIQARIRELQASSVERIEATVESIAAQLDADRTLAYKTNNPSAAVAASVAKAKLLGLMVDRATVNVTHNYAMMAEEELRFEIAAIHAEARALKPGVQH